MKILAWSFLSVLVLSSCAKSGGGDSAAVAPEKTQAPYFLPQNVNALVRMLPAPPNSASEDDKQQILDIARAEGRRTARQCARARAEMAITLDGFYGPETGPLSAAEVTRMKDFFTQVAADVEYVIRPAQRNYNLPHPSALNSSVHPCVKLGTPSSYPSEHAAAALVFARILQKVMPKLAQQFENRDLEAGQDRVYAGAERLNDVAAGRQLGEQIFAELMSSPDFRNRVQSYQGAMPF